MPGPNKTKSELKTPEQLTFAMGDAVHNVPQSSLNSMDCTLLFPMRIVEDGELSL
eukprot:jgi/Pico_ML_1/51402/g2436.t1